MSKTNKKQVGFYADEDIAEYLDSLTPNTKTRTINAALRAWRESRQTIQEPAYENVLESLIAWLGNQLDPFVLETAGHQRLVLADILYKFAHQEKIRYPSMSWQQVAFEGLTFPAPNGTPSEPHLSTSAAPANANLTELLDGIGSTSKVPVNRCVLCQIPVNDSNAINVPGRGRVCRNCFEFRLPNFMP